MFLHVTKMTKHVKDSYAQLSDSLLNEGDLHRRITK